MALNDKQRQIGRDNFNDGVDRIARLTRRQMLSGVAAGGIGAAGAYWGYDRIKEGGPVKAGLIGTGNQGCYAHISQSNPDYVKFVAFSDIRPSSQKRARRLFKEKYGAEAADVELYVDYRDMLEREDIELIVIATPLFLHKQMTVDAIEKGKHVLCEKLMAKTVTECKEMVRAADEAKKLLAIGHQRHYSYLYANALALIEQEFLGGIRHIDAYWHRNQTRDDSWHPEIPYEDRVYYMANPEELKANGFDSIEQLIRWRIDNRTGGGLMVELGSHQLDAASIFLHHKLPQAILGTGRKSWFSDDRDIDDHVFLNYEFGEDAHNAVVTYSSISTNAFDGYGEQVNGSSATMIIDKEAEAYVFREGHDTRNTRVTWAEQRLARPMADSGSTAAWGTGVGTQDTLTSRGYREEQEHMAWLIRNPDEIQWPEVGKKEFKPEDKRRYPRCHGRVALNDAVVALVSNLAMAAKQRVEMKPEWFDPYDDAAPENDIKIA